MTDWADEDAEKLVNQIRNFEWSSRHDGGRFRFDLTRADCAELLAAHLRLVESRGASRGVAGVAKAINVPLTEVYRA